MIAICLTVLGFVAQLGYFITRWIASGHAPVSNLFEFTTFFGMMLIAAFILIYFIYKTRCVRIIRSTYRPYYHCLCKYVPSGNITTHSGTSE